jgi:hypothetical protein
MTMVSLCTSRVKRQLDKCLALSTIDQLASIEGQVFRRRKLSPGLSVHLLLIQLLHRVSLQGLRHFHSLQATASAICQARARLPLMLFYRLIELLAVYARELAAHEQDLFFGLEILLLDGSSTRTSDTPQLAARYGKYLNQRRIQPGFPAPKLLCLMSCSTGLILRAMDLPAARQEHMLLGRLLKHLHAGRILLADRGLVSFHFLAQVLATGAQSVMRLPKKQFARASGLRQVIRELGTGDLLVQWSKTAARPGSCSHRLWKLLPPTISLRQITAQVGRPGFRTRSITVITTLVDPDVYPARQIIELYVKRWQIEVYFRDLKRSQGLERLWAKTLKGARKELLGHVLLYNLTRLVMLEAASRQGVEPNRISFLDALRHLRHAQQHQDLEGLLANPIRTRPTEPRRVKTRRSKYPPLNRPRSAYKQLPATAAPSAPN